MQQHKSDELLLNCDITSLLSAAMIVVACLCPFAKSADPDATAVCGNGTETFGCINGIQAHSFNGGLCNVGDAPLPGDIDENHPIWTTNIYRLHNHAFEQIGLSWVKHDNWTSELGGCLNCTFDLNCDAEDSDASLDPGCRDTYIACQNGIQDALGPRSQINPWTGAWPMSGTAQYCSGSSLIDCRVQIQKSDLENYAGADYFMEQQVISPDEPAAARNNNVSYRPLAVGSCSTSGCNDSTPLCSQSRSCSSCESNSTNCTYEISVDTLHCEEPAIHAWKDSDSSVVETEFSVSSDGKFILAGKAWQVAGTECMWHYEYALYNMNSDRAADGFIVPLPNDLSAEELAEIQASAGFHDIAYHSGEPYDSTDWTVPSTLTTSVPWSIASGSNNALYWGTLYNFRFQAPRPPVYSGAPATVTVDLYRSGSPTSVTGVSVAPGTTSALLRARCHSGDQCMITTECHCDDIGGVFTSATSCALSGCAMSP